MSNYIEADANKDYVEGYDCIGGHHVDEYDTDNNVNYMVAEQLLTKMILRVMITLVIMLMSMIPTTMVMTLIIWWQSNYCGLGGIGRDSALMRLLIPGCIAHCALCIVHSILHCTAMRIAHCAQYNAIIQAGGCSHCSWTQLQVQMLSLTQHTSY